MNPNCVGFGPYRNGFHEVAQQLSSQPIESRTFPLFKKLIYEGDWAASNTQMLAYNMLNSTDLIKSNKLEGVAIVYYERRDL